MADSPEDIISKARTLPPEEGRKFLEENLFPMMGRGAEPDQRIDAVVAAVQYMILAGWR